MTKYRKSPNEYLGTRCQFLTYLHLSTRDGHAPPLGRGQPIKRYNCNPSHKPGALWPLPPRFLSGAPPLAAGSSPHEATAYPSLNGRDYSKLGLTADKTIHHVRTWRSDFTNCRYGGRTWNNNNKRPRTKLGLQPTLTTINPIVILTTIHSNPNNYKPYINPNNYKPYNVIVTTINPIVILTTINRIVILTTINPIVILTTINPIVILTAINGIVIVTTINRIVIG